MFEAYFLDSRLGRIFCTGARQSENRRKGRMLILAPFGEEMNKSRHVLSALVRQFDDAGFDVILPDLFGTGDSEGDFGDATIDVWRADIDSAIAHLQGDAPVMVVGMRAGALLAVDAAKRHAFDTLTLIHPVADGRQLVNQLLRLRLAGGLMGSKNSETAAELRQRLAAGEALEIAGYRISAALAAGLEALSLSATDARPARRVNWLELVAESGRPLMPVSERVIAGWREAGTDVNAESVVCDSFWATQEIAQCPRLVDRVAALMSN